ncbi:MAG: DUF493 domain-containing protein [Crocinitomicaceae bacterium]
MKENTDDTYGKLKALLDNEKFPKPYIFKFIVLTAENKVSLVEACFDKSAKITLNYSKTKKYTTVNILQTMSSSQSIIDKYLLVGKIENVIHI